MYRRTFATGLAFLVLVAVFSPAAFANPEGAELHVAAPDGTAVRIDGKYQGRTPLEPIVVGAGRHRVVVNLKSGHEGRAWVDLAGGSTSRVVVRTRDRYPTRPMSGQTGRR